MHMDTANRHSGHSVDYHSLARPGKWQMTPISFILYRCTWPFIMAEEEQVVLCLN